MDENNFVSSSRQLTVVENRSDTLNTISPQYYDKQHKIPNTLQGAI